MKTQRAGTDKKIRQRIQFQQARQQQLIDRGLGYDAAVSQSCNEAKGLVLPLDRISVIDIIKHVEENLGANCIGIQDGLVRFQQPGNSMTRVWQPQRTEREIKRLMDAGFQVQALAEPGEWEARRRDFTIKLTWMGWSGVNRDGHANRRGWIYSSCKVGCCINWVDKAET